MTKPVPQASPPPVPLELIERRIYLIRGQKVMLDNDLAELYQASTKRLNEAVKRNLTRFPDDFMFRLTEAETEALNRSQIATGSQKHRDPRYPPYAFTELGVAMLSSVLHSPRAIQMNILIMRVFVRLREVLTSHRHLAQKIEQLERTQKQHGGILVALVQDVQKLKSPPVTRAIGFITRSSPRKKQV